MRPYPGGPTFVSCRVSKTSLDRLAGRQPAAGRPSFPLRRVAASCGDAPRAAAPKPPKTDTRSTIKVGVIDGGTSAGHPLLKGHVEDDESLAIRHPGGP